MNAIPNGGGGGIGGAPAPPAAVVEEILPVFRSINFKDIREEEFQSKVPGATVFISNQTGCTNNIVNEIHNNINISAPSSEEIKQLVSAEVERKMEEHHVFTVRNQDNLLNEIKELKADLKAKTQAEVELKAELKSNSDELGAVQDELRRLRRENEAKDQVIEELRRRIRALEHE